MHVIVEEGINIVRIIVLAISKYVKILIPIIIITCSKKYKKYLFNLK
jgi:hypothetical protein